jgi:hypothetical protein
MMGTVSLAKPPISNLKEAQISGQRLPFTSGHGVRSHYRAEIVLVNPRLKASALNC